MKIFINIAATRIRAAWGVLTSDRSVVITYDHKQPSNMLQHIYLCAPCQEVPERLQSATALARKWNTIDDDEGQDDALRQVHEILARPTCCQ